MCVYIYIYIYTYTHTYDHTYVYIYIYIHMYLSISKYTYVCFSIYQAFGNAGVALQQARRLHLAFRIIPTSD